MVEKQINEHGIAVWYDPDSEYEQLLTDINIDNTAILKYEDSFFRLRHTAEHYLEFLDENDRPIHDCSVPQQLLVYVPRNRIETNNALIELECAGAVIEPGANNLEQNTRLRVIAERVFKTINPDKVAEIGQKVDDGKYNLLDLDKIADDWAGAGTALVKLIFKTVSAKEVALEFLTTNKYDKDIQKKQAWPEISALLWMDLGIELKGQESLDEARSTLCRILLMTDLLTHIPEKMKPDSLKTLPIPSEVIHVEGIKSLCRDWRSRLDLRDMYVEFSHKVEKELSLSALHLPWLELSDCETFEFIEFNLIDYAATSVLREEIAGAKEIATQRIQTFWPSLEPTLQLQWKILENTILVLETSDNVNQSIIKTQKIPEDLILSYTQGDSAWYLLDFHFRHMEMYYEMIEIELGDKLEKLQKVISLARQNYGQTLHQMMEAFTQALERDRFNYGEIPQQRQVFSEKLLPIIKKKDRVAYILVDALRFEMGLELARSLTDEFEVSSNAVIAQPPTVTPVGMTSLLPGTEDGLSLSEVTSSRFVIDIQGNKIKDRQSRVNYLANNINTSFTELKLHQIQKPTKKRQEQIKNADFILVTSQEIDRWGEQAADDEEIHQIMSEVLDKLQTGIRRLKAMGISNIVVTADHGHVLGEPIDTGSKIDPPGGETFALHRRVWIGRGGKASESYIRVKASDLRLKGNFEFAFPRGLACFKTKGPSSSYFHGGTSLQEIVIPVIVLSAKEKPVEAASVSKVELLIDKKIISTRFFSVILTYNIEELFGPDEVRVKLVVMSGRKEVGYAVAATYGFEEGTKEITLKKGEPNTITVMLTETEGVESISCQVIDAITQAELASKKDISVRISI